ncbi:hypothetical protein PAAG_11934 [Paracoccidioides lutzii Pb01]|uniref:SWI5-dependent HO expression protein 3 n=1 Tax=Paracoccidioides lutzii (strain ATCC MYA-826 / Pb01) TaxID=502779 RepID=A0A0A2V0M3_PARBA|nr:hypothetical protein PAAG_11934 [Paracoccidioides lutzii Pb01]KGQ01356.1 hypothetical protein PAAG_11934 [Paracoccidioides lutzii Pb01]
MDRVKLVKNKFGFRKIPSANSSPLPVVVKHSAAEAPQIRLADVETQLNMHQFNGFFESAAPERLQQQSQSLQNGTSDGPHENSCVLDTATTRTAPSATATCNGESPQNPEWSSAVGHAMTGKSGRVIHNLQEDIARLTRECSLHRSRAEEAQRVNEALRLQLLNVTDRLRNSEQAHEAHLISIARKDRKIEELKAELQGEKERRLKAEDDARRTNQLAALERDEHHRAFAKANEIAAQARNQYDTLSRMRAKEQLEFRMRLDAARRELRELCGREVERQRQLTRFDLTRFDVIIEQKNREIEAERERMERFERLFAEYKEASDQAVWGVGGAE